MYSTNFHFYNNKNYLHSNPVKGLQGYDVGYGFAFNGQEKDDEVAGAGNTMTATFWEYDSRLGRRWNIDPKPDPSLSNYSTFDNNPILNIDHDGAYFFGLFGSTSEQRRTARDFAAATGGKIKDITNKNISVDFYTNTSGRNSNGDFRVSAKKNNIKFLSTGGFDFGDDVINRSIKWQYESSLAMGDYNIYTGYPKGSGALVSPTIDPVDVIAGGLYGVVNTGFRLSARLSTEAGKRIFWSGGEDAMEAATAFAMKTGKTTLGMTRAGQNLQKLITTRNIPWIEARPMWARLSIQYAKGAKGSVHFFGTQNAGSIWLQFEKPILIKKGVEIIPGN